MGAFLPDKTVSALVNRWYHKERQQWIFATAGRYRRFWSATAFIFPRPWARIFSSRVGCPVTAQLVHRAAKVASVELDVRLYPVLRETMSGADNFTLIEGDAMKLDFPQVIQEHFAGLRPILCANLPYNITTPILTKCVESRCFDSLTVLIQKEVAERICARAGTAEYGAFTVLMQYYTDPQLLFTVPPTCFLPAPKVTSAVIHCPVRKAPPVDVVSESALWRTVKAAFALRRKTLVNSLQTGYQLPKEQLTEIVTACGLEPSVRGERLTLEDFARLTNALSAAEQAR